MRSVAPLSYLVVESWKAIRACPSCSPSDRDWAAKKPVRLQRHVGFGERLGDGLTIAGHQFRSGGLTNFILGNQAAAIEHLLREISAIAYRSEPPLSRLPSAAL